MPRGAVHAADRPDAWGIDRARSAPRDGSVSRVGYEAWTFDNVFVCPERQGCGDGCRVLSVDNLVGRCARPSKNPALHLGPWALFQ